MTPRLVDSTSVDATPAPATALRRHTQGLPVYLLGSCLALAVDTAVLMMTLGSGLSLAMAAAAGFMSGMSVSYFVSVRYAFAQRAVRDRRWEYAGFALIGLLGLGATQLLLTLLTAHLHLSVLAAKAVTATLVFGLNYSLRKQLLFTQAAGVRHI